MKTGKNIRVADRLVPSDFTGSGFAVRTHTPIRAVTRFLTILTLLSMGIAVGLYYNNYRGMLLAVGVGSIVVYIGRRLERQEMIQQSTEFMNALFSSALGEGYRFCTVIRQNGEIVYLNRAFQLTFPSFIEQPKRDLETFFAFYNIEAGQNQKILSLITSGTEGKVTIRITGAGDASLEQLDLCIKPIKSPAGFMLLRGQ